MSNGVHRRDFTSSSGHKKLVIVAADFCLKRSGDCGEKGGWFAYAGRGCAYWTTLRQLEVVTASVREEFERPVIVWMVHFPPLDDDAYAEDENDLKLVDGRDVIEAAKTSGVKLILAGHLHRDYVTDTTPAIWCAGSACAVATDGPFLVHDINIDVDMAEKVTARRSTYEYRRKTGMGRFFEKRDTVESCEWSLVSS